MIHLQPPLLCRAWLYWNFTHFNLSQISNHLSPEFYLFTFVCPRFVAKFNAKFWTLQWHPFTKRVHVQSSPIGKATSVVHIVHTVSLTLLFCFLPYALERWNARVIKIDGFESRSKLPERCYSFCKKSWTAMSLDANGFLSIGTSRSEPCVITKCSQQIEGNLYKSVVKRFTHLG